MRQNLGTGHSRPACRRARGSARRTADRRARQLCVPTMRSLASREQRLRGTETDAMHTADPIEKAQQYAFQRVVDFPVMRRNAKVAAGAARLFESRHQMVDRGAR